MNFLRMKILYYCALIAVISFSLMGSCPGSEAFCLTQHNDVEMSNSSDCDHTHEISEDSHVHNVEESHHMDLFGQCCRTSSKAPSDCARIFVLANMTKTIQSALIATFSDQIATSCFLLSETNSISEIFNTINPALASLRTVILLT